MISAKSQVEAYLGHLAADTSHPLIANSTRFRHRMEARDWAGAIETLIAIRNDDPRRHQAAHLQANAFLANWAEDVLSQIREIYRTGLEEEKVLTDFLGH